MTARFRNRTRRRGPSLFPTRDLEAHLRAVTGDPDLPVVGIDEVGMGALAGPLVVAGVILPRNEPAWTAELKDSKKVKPAKRSHLYGLILRDALWASAMASAREIDEMGLAAAHRMAIANLLGKLPGLGDVGVVMDGYRPPAGWFTQRGRVVAAVCVPRADAAERCVAAASIVAKVERDFTMVSCGQWLFPKYNWHNNKGYGTPQHLEAIRQWGLCVLHRRSFLKGIVVDVEVAR